MRYVRGNTLEPYRPRSRVQGHKNQSHEDERYGGCLGCHIPLPLLDSVRGGEGGEVTIISALGRGLSWVFRLLLGLGGEEVELFSFSLLSLF